MSDEDYKDENRFEIFPVMGKGKVITGTRIHPKGPTGEYMFRFVYANGEVGPVSQQRYGSRSDANRGIHDFMSAINRDHPHPPIIGVGE